MATLMRSTDILIRFMIHQQIGMNKKEKNKCMHVILHPAPVHLHDLSLLNASELWIFVNLFSQQMPNREQKLLVNITHVHTHTLIMQVMSILLKISLKIVFKGKEKKCYKITSGRMCNITPRRFICSDLSKCLTLLERQ